MPRLGFDNFLSRVNPDGVARTMAPQNVGDGVWRVSIWNGAVSPPPVQSCADNPLSTTQARVSGSPQAPADWAKSSQAEKELTASSSCSHLGAYFFMMSRNCCVAGLSPACSKGWVYTPTNAFLIASLPSMSLGL